MCGWGCKCASTSGRRRRAACERRCATRVELLQTFTFEATHWRPTFPEGHKRRQRHGHSFRAAVRVAGAVDERRGYLVDHGEIKTACEPVRKQLDHSCLNEIPGLSNPTAEVLARWIWERLKAKLPGLAAVIVFETCTTGCEYRGL